LGAVRSMFPKGGPTMRTVHFGAALLALGFATAWARADDSQKPSQAKEADKLQVAKKVLDQAQMDLVKAMEQVKKKVPDGHLIAIRAEMQQGNTRFGAYLLVGDKIHEMELDAVTGEVKKSQKLDRRQYKDLSIAEAKKAFAKGKVSLAQAVAMGTEKVKDGKPFEAEWELQGDKVVIEVELLARGQITKVRIDPTDTNQIE